MVEDRFEYYRKRVMKNRCKACYPCPMGVVGCISDKVPHSHGGGKRCEECGVPYYEIHPHSKCCSKGSPILNHLVHDDWQKKWQLQWDCRKD